MTWYDAYQITQNFAGIGEVHQEGWDLVEMLKKRTSPMQGRPVSE